MIAKHPLFDGICTVYDCLDQWIQALCLIGALVCCLIVWVSLRRWFR